MTQNYRHYYFVIYLLFLRRHAPATLPAKNIIPISTDADESKPVEGAVIIASSAFTST